MRNVKVSVEKPSGLDPRTLALVRIAAATATGDESKLRDRMIAARAVHVPPPWVDELLLQSFLNVGYPLALVAFGVWRSVAGPVLESEKGESIAHPDWDRWTKRGVEACGEVYGRTFHKLMLNLRALHPAVEPLVVVDAYGKILARPGLDSKRRELCTLAAIAMLRAERQWHSHWTWWLWLRSSPVDAARIRSGISCSVRGPQSARTIGPLVTRDPGVSSLPSSAS